MATLSLAKDIYSVVVVCEKRSSYDLVTSVLQEQDSFAIRTYWQSDVDEPLSPPIDTISDIDCFIFVAQTVEERELTALDALQDYARVVISTTCDEGLEDTLLERGVANLIAEEDLRPAALARSVFFARGMQQIHKVRTQEIKRTVEAGNVHALGKIASRIAHDLNNTLGAIIGHLDLIKLSSDGHQDIERSADLALESSERARLLIEHISAFSDREKSDRKTINLQQTILETVDLLNRLLPKNIKVSSKLDRSRSLHIMVNPVELRQVLINLAINAQEAMPDGGSLFFEFEIVSGAATGKKNTNQEYVRLSLRDTGMGILPEHIDHVFEPAFTTKEGLSLGLGLSTVYRVLQEHKGWVDIESQVGEGTVVSLYFPLHDESSASQQTAKVIPISRTTRARKGTILVIEDESILCELVKLYLEAAGFDAVIFTRPTEAIKWFEQHSSEVDLVLLDMIMPELSGKKCFNKLQAINSEVPIALCSGFLDHDVHSLLSAGAVKFFQKPGRYPLMVTWIAEALQKD